MTKSVERKLTDKQSAILDYIKQKTKDSGYPPSVREIGDRFGITVKGAYDHIKAIEKKGFLKTEQNKSRSMVVIDRDGDMLSDAVQIPLVGRIAAGAPIYAEENVEEYLSFPRSLFSGGEYFALHVRGDSMIDAGIYDRDIAIIKKQETALNGEIVAALLDDEATLKRFKLANGKINLMPENTAYEPIVTNKAEILGKLAGVFRKY